MTRASLSDTRLLDVAVGSKRTNFSFSSLASAGSPSASLGRSSGQRPGSRADGQDRGRWNAQRRADLARVHRALHLEGAVLRGGIGAVGRVDPAELRGYACSEIASVEGRAGEHGVRAARLRMLRDGVRVRDGVVAIGAGDFDDLAVAERRRLRGDLGADATDPAVVPFRDDQDLL